MPNADLWTDRHEGQLGLIADPVIEAIARVKFEYGLRMAVIRGVVRNFNSWVPDFCNFQFGKSY